MITNYWYSFVLYLFYKTYTVISLRQYFCDSHYCKGIVSAMVSQIAGVFDCLFILFFWHKSKKTSKLCATGLCEESPPLTDGFPSQRSGNAKNDCIWCVVKCFVTVCSAWSTVWHCGVHQRNGWYFAFPDGYLTLMIIATYSCVTLLPIDDKYLVFEAWMGNVIRLIHFYIFFGIWITLFDCRRQLPG